jgi:hypothetical protein
MAGKDHYSFAAVSGFIVKDREHAGAGAAAWFYNNVSRDPSADGQSPTMAVPTIITIRSVAITATPTGPVTITACRLGCAERGPRSAGAQHHFRRNALRLTTRDNLTSVRPAQRAGFKPTSVENAGRRFAPRLPARAGPFLRRFSEASIASPHPRRRLAWRSFSQNCSQGFSMEVRQISPPPNNAVPR